MSGRRVSNETRTNLDFNIRLDKHRVCVLALMGATADGKKELRPPHPLWNERA